MRKESFIPTWHGVVFVFLIAQQIIAYVFDPFKFVSLYWIFVTLFTIVFFFKLHIKITKKNVKPFILFILCSGGAVVNTITGSPLGYGLSICFYSFMAFVGVNFITKHKINTFVFIPFFVIMYIFFYYRYFMFDEVTRMSLDNDLFVQASSNTISMALNMVLIIYWMVSQGQSENHKWFYLGIAVINLVLIIIQGSRAGILVAFILAALSFVNLGGSGLNINFRLRFFIPIMVIFALLYYFQDSLLDFMVERKMEGVTSFEENVRYFAQIEFFNEMNFTHFIFGYPKGYEFTLEITRTFNAFLDLWSRCGIAPLLYLLYCLFYRIKYHKQFAIPVLLLVPFFVYTPFESLWGGTLWDICVYFTLFYSYTGLPKQQWNSKNDNMLVITA